LKPVRIGFFVFLSLVFWRLSVFCGDGKTVTERMAMPRRPPGVHNFVVDERQKPGIEHIVYSSTGGNFKARSGDYFR